MSEELPPADDEATAGAEPNDPFDGPGWDKPPLTTSPPTTSAPGSTGAGRGKRVRISRRRRRRRRRQRRLGLLMVILGGLVVLGGVWIVITGLLARSQLDQARADIHTLRKQISAGHVTAARKTAADLADHAHRAHELTTGPAWAIGGWLPGGGPVATVRGVTASIDNLGTNVLPELVRASQRLDPATLRAPDGAIDVARIASVAPTLNRAAAAMTQATAAVRALPAHTWLSPVDHARSDAVSQLSSLSQTVQSADLAATIAPSMLGEHGPKYYMISFETEAELRGTGGLPGAFAIVRADHGKLKFTKFESDSTLGGVTSGLDFGAAYNQLYADANATEVYADSNVSPHFPYAAQIWTAMWQKYSGQHLDGALAIDPTALSYLLKVTGPATLPDGSQVSAANVVALTQQRVYAKFPSLDGRVQSERKAYQLDIARAISKHLLKGRANTTSLLRAAGKAAGQRRLLLWASDPRIENQLARTSLSGVVAKTSAPYLGLTINNAAANKLDYYTHASLKWKRTGCGPTRTVTATITMRNAAPRDLPAYALGQTGQPGFPQNPGDNRVRVGYFATDGAQLNGITLNGKPSTASVGTERGHPVYTVELELPRGQTQTVVLHLSEPAGSGSPVMLPQPLVNPLKVSVEDAKCS